MSRHSSLIHYALAALVGGAFSFVRMTFELPLWSYGLLLVLCFAAGVVVSRWERRNSESEPPAHRRGPRYVDDGAVHTPWPAYAPEETR